MRATKINKNHENPFAFSQMNAAHCIAAKKQKVNININY